MTHERYDEVTGAEVAWDLIQLGRHHEAAAILLEVSPEPPWRVLAICGIRVSTWKVDHDGTRRRDRSRLRRGRWLSHVERLPAEGWDFRIPADGYAYRYQLPPG